MHNNSFYVYGNKTEFLLMDHTSLNKTSCLLFPSGLVFSILLYLALLTLGWWRVSKCWQWKPVKRVWWFGVQPRRHCARCSTLTPECLKSSSKEKSLPWDENSIFFCWLKSSCQRLQVHHKLNRMNWNYLIHNPWNFICSFSSHLGNLKYLFPFISIFKNPLYVKM